MKLWAIAAEASDNRLKKTVITNKAMKLIFLNKEYISLKCRRYFSV